MKLAGGRERFLEYGETYRPVGPGIHQASCAQKTESRGQSTRVGDRRQQTVNFSHGTSVLDGNPRENWDLKTKDLY